MSFLNNREPDEYEDFEEPYFIDWKNQKISVGDRVVVDIMPERVQRPHEYSGTIVFTDIDDSGAYVVVLCEDGEKEVYYATFTRAYGDPTFEISDLLKVGT